MQTEATGENSVLIQKFNEGDQRAFNEIYNRFKSRLLIYADNLINNLAESEDIVQETFIKLFVKYSQFQTLTNIQAFLYLITRNACLDWLRKKKTAKKWWGKKVELSDDLHSYDTPESDLADIETEVIIKLMEEVDALPPVCQKIFKMHYFEGKRKTDIASELGISKATVTGHIKTAAGKLRRVITLLILGLLISFFIK